MLLFLHRTRGAVDEAHRFWSLPSVKQELAIPGSAKMRRTRSLFLGSTCVCVCVVLFEGYVSAALMSFHLREATRGSSV